MRSAPTGWPMPWAATLLYPGPLIVVDFGTATTFDVIDGEGNYIGGVIAPGINLSLEALHHGDGQAAAHRGRAAQPRDRQGHAGRHAVGHLSGAMSA